MPQELYGSLHESSPGTPNGTTKKSHQQLAELKKAVNATNKKQEVASWKDLQDLEGDRNRNNVLAGLDASNSYLALVNIGSLTLDERQLLRGKIVLYNDPILAYLALLDVKGLTEDESKTLKMTIQSAFQDIYEYLTPPALRDGINALLRAASIDEHRTKNTDK